MQAFKTATEQLNTQNNVEKSTTTTSSTLIENEPYGNTPIWIRGNKENGYFATIGNYKITGNFVEKENLINALDKPDLELIIKIQTVMIDASYEMYKYEIKNETEETKQ